MSGNAIIRLRRDTAANWTAGNPVLALGEPGFETDTRKIKLGNGATAWAGLGYLASVATSVADADYGDISISSGVWTIDGGAVSLAKMADMATASLFYRKTAGAGPPEVQSLATLKADLLLTGTNSGDQFTNMTTARFLGRITAGFGAAEEITAAQAKTLLAIAAVDVSGLGYFATGTDAANLTGTVAAARLPALTGGDVTSPAGSGTLTIGAGKITLAMQADMATASVVYRKTAGAGAPEVQTLATLKADLGLATVASSGLASDLTGTLAAAQLPAFTGGDVTASAGSTALTLGIGAVSLTKIQIINPNSILGNITAGAAAPSMLTTANVKTMLAITESDVANLTTDLAAKAPLANPEFTGVAFYQQGAPTARNSTTTLTIADLLTLIITSTSTTAVSLTLPTGTLTDAGILSGALPNNGAFEWYLINLGSSSGAVTLVAGTAHTIVGSAVVAIGVSARFLTRKTGTNTFITYRIA